MARTKGDNFIFLMCSERSGSNLITRIMDARPEISAPPTSHMADLLLPNLFRYGDLADPRQWSQLLDDLFEIHETRTFLWKHAFTRAEVASFAEPGDVAGLLAGVYLAEAAEFGKSTVFVKENRIYEYSHFLDRHFPNARYLFMVRDPRDMALSWNNSTAMRGGIVRGARHWQRDQHGFACMSGWLSNRRSFLRYEDLLADPAGALRRVCRELDLEFVPEMLSFHEDEQTRANAARIVDIQNTGKPILTENSKKFRTDLTTEQISFIEAVCREEMAWFGYAPEAPVVDGAALEQITARLEAQEPYEKEAFQALSEQEKALRRGRRAVMTRIWSRHPAFHAAAEEGLRRTA